MEAEAGEYRQQRRPTPRPHRCRQGYAPVDLLRSYVPDVYGKLLRWLRSAVVQPYANDKEGGEVARRWARGMPTDTRPTSFSLGPDARMECGPILGAAGRGTTSATFGSRHTIDSDTPFGASLEVDALWYQDVRYWTSPLVCSRLPVNFSGCCTTTGSQVGLLPLARANLKAC